MGYKIGINSELLTDRVAAYPQVRDNSLSQHFPQGKTLSKSGRSKQQRQWSRSQLLPQHIGPNSGCTGRNANSRCLPNVDVIAAKYLMAVSCGRLMGDSNAQVSPEEPLDPSIRMTTGMLMLFVQDFSSSNLPTT